MEKRHPDFDDWMRKALREAEKALRAREVPVGAVVVKEGRVLGRGHNRTEKDRSALKHAEMEALRSAAKKLGGWRLENCDLYVTLEPCTMCAGAIVLSRIRRLVFGARDPKAGAVVSTARVLENPALNHRVQVEGGVLEAPCSQILSSFFKELRTAKEKTGGFN